MDKLLLTSDECSKTIGVCRSLVEQLMADGRIPSVELGGKRLVPACALEEWTHRLTPGLGDAGKRSVPRTADLGDLRVPTRARDWERWRAIWRKASSMDRVGNSVAVIVKTLKEQWPELKGVSADTLPAILRAGRAGLLD